MKWKTRWQSYPNSTFQMQKISPLLLIILCLWTAHGRAKEVIRVGIGTQDTTINCAAGGPVVRELKLLDKYLPHDGKYKDATYEINWVNLPTGAQLNNELLAGRLDIVSMADFPAILGYDSLLSKNDGVKTLYISSLSLGLRGAGNALLVPLNSSVQSIADLKGKTISVPFASTAHAFLLRAVQNQGWDPIPRCEDRYSGTGDWRFRIEVWTDRCACRFRSLR